jgi:ankyrin repeat protein
MAMNEDADPFRDQQLHFAAQDGDVPLVQSLVDAGHDVNAFDDLGKTPLHYAVESERFEVARYLVERGADVNAHHEPTIGNTPLCEVAERCSLRMAQFLIAAGADPTIPGWMQLTALEKAKRRQRGDGPQVYELLMREAKARPRL